MPRSVDHISMAGTNCVRCVNARMCVCVHNNVLCSAGFRLLSNTDANNSSHKFSIRTTKTPKNECAKIVFIYIYTNSFSSPGWKCCPCWLWFLNDFHVNRQETIENRVKCGCDACDRRLKILWIKLTCNFIHILLYLLICCCSLMTR